MCAGIENHYTNYLYWRCVFFSRCRFGKKVSE